MKRWLDPFVLEKLDPALEREVLLSLKAVGTLMLWIYGVSVVLWGLLWVLPAAPKAELTVATPRFDFGLTEAYLVVMLGLEAWYRAHLEKMIAQNKPFPRAWNLVIVGLEASQPTFFLFVWSLILPPSEALSQSPLFFYFIFISVNALRLDAAVSVFSGLVSAVGYVGLAAWLAVSHHDPDPVKTVLSLYLSKGIFLFVCGALMAFVAHQMRQRLVHSLKSSASILDLLKQKEEAERISQERLAQELHDSVGQNLGFLNLQAQSLEETLVQKHYTEVAEGLKKISSAAREAQNDIRDFLFDVRATQVLTQGFQTTLQAFLQRFSAESGILIEVRGEPDAWEEGLTAERRIQAFKILQEALVNSRKHAGTRSATLTLGTNGQNHHLIIEDQGAGFDPSAGPPEHHYGLAIMNERARRVGGILTIESAPGQGVRIGLEFGPEPRERRQAGRDPRLTATTKPTSVLVADDHRLFREGLCHLLQSAGYPIVGTAASGREALQVAAETRPDVVLMDIHMPDMDGLMATRTLKSSFPGIKIIILTASTSVPQLHEAVKAGASGFAPKSLEAEALFALIDGTASGEVTLSPEVADRVLKDFPPPAEGLAGNPFDLLSARQLQVLQWAAAGLTYKEIGAKLFISERTVKFHMGEVVEKLQVKDRIEATKLLQSRGT